MVKTLLLTGIQLGAGVSTLAFSFALFSFFIPDFPFSSLGQEKTRHGAVYLIDREGAARNCAAACGFSRVTCGESVFPHPSELCKSRRCTSSAPLPPASTPRLACKQKGKGEGPGESRSPYARQGARLPQPSAKGLLLAGFSRDPWFSPDPTTAVRTPSQP